MTLLVRISTSTAGRLGERLVGVDAASRITLEASHQARPLDWYGQLIIVQRLDYIYHPVAIHAPACSSCKATLHWLCKRK
jgi:hypothetical protein